MIKSLLIALLYSQIHSQEYTGVFRGCTAPSLFSNSESALTTSIDFSFDCTNFQECANSFNTTKQECLQNFSTAQELVCSSFTDNRRLKRYCEKIVFENMKIVRNLEDSKFNSYFNAFYGMINRFKTDYCFVNININLEEYIYRECDSNDDMIFSFVQLSNGKFVIDGSGNRCFKTSNQYIDCNYNDKDLWIDFSLGNEAKNEILFVNENTSSFFRDVLVLSVFIYNKTVIINLDDSY